MVLYDAKTSLQHNSIVAVSLPSCYEHMTEAHVSHSFPNPCSGGPHLYPHFAVASAHVTLLPHYSVPSTSYKWLQTNIKAGLAWFFILN